MVVGDFYSTYNLWGPLKTGLSNAWPAMLSGVARVEIKAVKKLHGGKNFDAITKLHRNYFGSYSIKFPS